MNKGKKYDKYKMKKYGYLKNEETYKETLRKRSMSGVIDDNYYKYIAEFNDALYFISPDEPELNDDTEYDSLKDSIYKGMTWGQMKLLSNSVLFLIMFWDPEEYPEPTVVYAGAGPGKNVGILGKMFPTITFHLYDPADNFSVRKSDKIFLHVEYFTNEIAKSWAGKDVFLWSDIRREVKADTLKDKIHKELMVIGDQEMQYEWHKIMNPIKSMLKFRMPNNQYLTDLKKYDYLYGYVMDQPAKPSKSRETRLIPVGNDKVTWDINKYINRLNYRNNLVRSETKFYNIFDGSEDDNQKGKYDNSFDTTFILSIFRDYLSFIDEDDSKVNTLKMTDKILTLLNKK